MKKILTVLFASLFMMALPMAAQDEGKAGADLQASTEKKAESPESHGDFFGQALAGHWAFTTELSVGQEYDDNVFSSSFSRLSDNLTRFSGRFSVAVQKKRLRAQF